VSERERERGINSIKSAHRKGNLPEPCQLAVAHGEGSYPEQRQFPRVPGITQCKDNIPGHASDDDEGSTPSIEQSLYQFWGLGQVKAIIGFIHASLCTCQSMPRLDCVMPFAWISKKFTGNKLRCSIIAACLAIFRTCAYMQ